MLTQDTRSMTTEERNSVEDLLKLKPETLIDKLIRGFIALAGLSVLGLLTAAILGTLLERLGILEARRPSPAMLFILKIGVLLGFIFGVILMIKGRGTNRKVQHRYNDDLKENKVQATHCIVSGVIEVQEFEDEGPGFFLDIGEGRILFIQGQYLYKYVESKRFPNKEFDLIKLPYSNVVLDVICKGDYLVPLRVLKPSVIADKYVPFVYDGDVFDGKLDTIESDLNRFKSKKT